MRKRGILGRAWGSQESRVTVNFFHKVTHIWDFDDNSQITHGYYSGFIPCNPNGHQPLWTSIVLGTCEPHSHSLVWWLQLHHIVSTVPLLDHQTWLIQVPLSCTWRIHYMKKRKQKKNVFHVTESLEVRNANTFLKTKGLMFFNAVFLSLRSWTAVLGVESKCHFSVLLLCRNRHFW